MPLPFLLFNFFPKWFCTRFACYDFLHTNTHKPTHARNHSLTYSPTQYSLLAFFFFLIWTQNCYTFHQTELFSLTFVYQLISFSFSYCYFIWSGIGSVCTLLLLPSLTTPLMSHCWPGQHIHTHTHTWRVWHTHRKKKREDKNTTEENQKIMTTTATSERLREGEWAKFVCHASSMATTALHFASPKMVYTHWARFDDTI